MSSGVKEITVVIKGINQTLFEKMARISAMNSKGIWKGKCDVDH
jgi:hypothetical protein